MKPQNRPINKVFIGAITGLYFILPFLPDMAFSKQNKRSEDVIFTCDEFPKKIQNCEDYTCYVTMGGVMTVTEIIGERGPLCAVSSTIGVTLPTPKLKPGEELPTPTTILVTTICEYDREGINQLSNKFEAMKDGRFDFTSEETEIGEHNCQTYTLGQNFPTPRSHIKSEIWQ